MAVLYRHIRLDSNQPFYIGIGKTEKRAYSKKDRNNYWKHIVEKHGYKVHIMMDELTWDEAQKKEREFIQLYGRKDLGKGGLVNMTDGGDGLVGYKHTEEAIAKMSAASLGKPKSEEAIAKLKDALTGRKQSEEHIAKVSAALTGKPKPPRTAEHNAKISATLTGRKQSEEHIAKRSATMIGKPKSEEAIAKRTATRKANKLLKTINDIYIENANTHSTRN